MERKILLNNIAVPGIRTFEVFRSTGGYLSVEKALKEMIDAPLAGRSTWKPRFPEGLTDYTVDLGKAHTVEIEIHKNVSLVIEQC